MNTRESLKAFLELAELSSVGTAEERAAFIAIHIEARTVRSAADAIGVSKSQVTNLADLFLAKLVARMRDIERERLSLSKDYLEMRSALEDKMYELQDESGSDNFNSGYVKIGNFYPDGVSREDWAEATGTPLGELDD